MLTFEDLSKIRLRILSGEQVTNEELREAIQLARQTRAAAGTPKAKAVTNGEKKKPLSLDDIGAAF